MLPASTLALAAGSVVASLILIPNSNPEINIFEAVQCPPPSLIYKAPSEPVSTIEISFKVAL